MGLNIAALFFRFLGSVNEAVICIKEALKVILSKSFVVWTCLVKSNEFNDIALTQLGQILIDVSISGNFATTSELDDFIERVLNVVISWFLK